MAKENAASRKARLGTTFYHVTTLERLASIASSGFDPAHSRTGNGLLYLTPDAGHALAYAEHHGDASVAVLIAVRGEDLDPAMLGPDDVDLPDLVGDAWERYGWLRSARESGQCTYAGVVPASGFRAVPCPEGRVEGGWEALEHLAARLAPVPAP